jgi:hypothetical protein
VSSARIIVAWTEPANTDGTVIRDGSHYEVQYRLSGDTAWRSSVIGFDFQTLQLLGLTVATEYEVRVRAVDIASPPHYGVWSDTVQVTTPGDTLPPSTPAAPTVASASNSIQVVHTLGIADGGTYNLEPDLKQLQVHASDTGPGYEPDATTLVGRMSATFAMMAAQVPAIGTFQVTSTAALWVKVIAEDESGNPSAASVAAQSTAILIPAANIGDLTADKIVSGDFRGALGLLGLFRTAVSGARFEAGTNDDTDLTGFRLYRPSGTLALNGDASTGDFLAYQPDGAKKTFQIAADTGNVYLYGADGTTPALSLTAATGQIDMIGKVTAETTGTSGDRLEVNPAFASHNYTGTRPALVFYTEDDPPGPAFITGNTDSGTSYLSMYSGPSVAGPVFTQSALRLYPGELNLQIDDGNPANDQAQLRLIGGGGGGSIAVLDAGGAKGVVIGNVVQEFGWDVNNRLVTSSTGSQLVSGGLVKSFVIPHPVDESRWLVHGCTESPTAGVEYAGQAEIVDQLAIVELPAYFEALCEAEGRYVFLSPMITSMGRQPMVPSAAASEVSGGRFHILCAAPDGTRINWLVKATRKDAGFPVEPLRSEVTVSGDGPYRYLSA